jgi:hypothetical protein
MVAMSSRFAITALLMIGMAAAPGTLRAVPWFPSEAGPTFTFTYGTVVIGDGPTPSAFSRSLCMGGAPWGCESQVFQVDTEGDVEYLSLGISGPAMPDPDITTYDAPLKYLDFPLETGRQWSSSAGIIPWDPQATPVQVTLAGEVIGPETCTAPAGVFDVIVVRLTLTSADEPWRNWTRTLWLHHQLGPVNDLVSWTGVVGTGPISWGSLKATWR